MIDRSFFERKMSDLQNRSFFAHFCSFALFERAREWLLFLKEQKSNHSFWKSERVIALLVALLKRAKKSDRSFAFLQRAPKWAIAHLLFLKEQMSKWSHNPSFEKSGNERRANEQLPNPAAAGLSIRSFWKWAINLFFEQKMSNLENRSFLLFCSFWKIRKEINLFIALFERAKGWLLFLLLFLKERKSDPSFGRSFEKSEKEQLLNRSFEKSGNENWANERLPNPAL